MGEKKEKITLTKEEFLMIASYICFQAREDEKKESLRWKKVNEIINNHIDPHKLYEFQDNREDQYLKEK